MRIGAFLLGVLFGILLVVGGVAGGVYYAVTTLKPADISQDTQTYMGDLANMSVLDIINELKSLYTSQIGVTDDEGNYFSLGDFCEKYNIDLSVALGQTLPQELMNVPLLEMFAGADSSGQTGFQRSLKQVKVSAIPAVINLFPKDDGGAIADEVMAELANYSVADLLDQNLGVAYVFQNICFADLLPDAFAEQSADNKLMWALGQGSVGKLYGAMQGSSSMFLQLKEGGALETLGQLPAVELLSGDEMMQNILGDMVVADIIDDNGNMALGSVLDSLYLGNLLGNSRKEVDIANYNNTLIDGVVVSDGTSYAKIDGDKWYAAELPCDEEHTHTADCYTFCWYSDSNCTTPVDALYAPLVNLRVSDLTSGSSDAILNAFRDVKLGDLMGENVSGVMASFADMTVGQLLDGAIDDIFAGALLGYNRTEVDIVNYNITLINGVVVSNGTSFAKIDSDKWYDAELTCKDQDAVHEHTADCYGFVWTNNGEQLTAIMKKVANCKVGQLGSLADSLTTLTVGEVLENDNLTGVLAALKDVPIGQLSTEIDNVYIGNVMNLERTEIVVTDLTTTVADGVVPYGSAFAKLDGQQWFEAALKCADKTEDHTHTADCYGFVWRDSAGVAATGITNKMADKKIGQLDDLNGLISSLTIGDVFSPEELTGILKELEDVPINQLATEIDNLLLGSVMGYFRKEVATESWSQVVEGVVTDGANFAKLHNDVWYQAELTCTEIHTHAADCYEFVWYTDSGCTTLVDGVQKAFVNAKVANAASVMDTLTLRKLGIGGNNILDALQDVPIADLSAEIDQLKLGTVLGYVEHDADADGVTEWYHACADDCGHDSADHVLIDGANYTKVTGINGKLAVETIGNFSSGDGITEIAIHLTVGDLIESGMMSLGETADEIVENEAKFNILFCNDQDATFTESVTVGGITTGSKTYHCTLADFLVYKAANPDCTAVLYYAKFDHNATCSGAWRDMEVAVFVAELLAAID